MRPRLPDDVRAHLRGHGWPASFEARRAAYDGTLRFPDVRRSLLAWVYEAAPRGPGGAYPTAAGIAALTGLSVDAVRGSKSRSKRTGGPWPDLPLDPGGRPPLDAVTPEGERSRQRRAKTAAEKGR